MEKREEIRNNPWEVLMTTLYLYNKFDLYIKIEIVSEHKNLYLLQEYMCIGTGKLVHNYDQDGRNFFNALMRYFGDVWLLTLGEKEIESFVNYEDFLDRITWKLRMIDKFYK